MERKIKFVESEYYHLYSRGVEKRKIFQDQRDYSRFLGLLYILNQDKYFHVSNFLNKGNHKPRDLFELERGSPVISIRAYSLMPNHFHLVVQEIVEGGVSVFMMKLLTAYSMYFNKKYERSGALFVHPFRSSHLDDDIYFRHIFNYVHLNCVDLCERDWKSSGIKNKDRSEKFLATYPYSSYPDFLEEGKRIESKILDMGNLPSFVSRATLDISSGDFKEFKTEFLSKYKK